MSHCPDFNNLVGQLAAYEAIDVRSDRFDREDIAKKLDILIYDIKKLHDFLSTTKALMS